MALVVVLQPPMERVYPCAQGEAHPGISQKFQWLGVTLDATVPTFWNETNEKQLVQEMATHDDGFLSKAILEQPVSLHWMHSKFTL